MTLDTHTFYREFVAGIFSIKTQAGEAALLQWTSLDYARHAW